MGPGAKADHEAEIKEVIEGASLPALEETLAAPAAVSTSTLNLMDDTAALVISPSLGGDTETISGISGDLFLSGRWFFNASHGQPPIYSEWAWVCSFGPIS
jgi:hypothetical protein